VWTSAACKDRGPRTVNPHRGTPNPPVLPCDDRSPLSTPAWRREMATAKCGVLLRPRICRTCSELFGICRHCDRGHCYCSDPCREKARRQQRRNANRRYEQSLGEAGCEDHCTRQRDYRQRLKARVTDQSSLPPTVDHRMPLAVAARWPSQPKNPSTKLSGWSRCIVCGRRGRFVGPYR
jgi:hypothetical protein